MTAGTVILISLPRITYISVHDSPESGHVGDGGSVSVLPGDLRWRVTANLTADRGTRAVTEGHHQGRLLPQSGTRPSHWRRPPLQTDRCGRQSAYNTAGKAGNTLDQGLAERSVRGPGP